MKEQINWIHTLYVFGVIALIIGAFDPLEGSVVIVIGSAFIALSTYLTRYRHWRLFLLASILIFIGVSFMFYLSSLGGIGGKSVQSLWWGLLILPYPIGWLISIVLLVIWALKNKKEKRILKKQE